MASLLILSIPISVCACALGDRSEAHASECERPRDRLLNELPVQCRARFARVFHLFHRAATPVGVLGQVCLSLPTESVDSGGESPLHRARPGPPPQATRSPEAGAVF